MKEKKKFRKVIALFMMLVIGTQGIPQQVYANIYNSNKPVEELAPYIVAEDTSLREETVKHFKKSDGTMMAVDYGMPVHYQEDGVWKDYDNSISQINDENGVYYKSNHAGTEVLLPEQLNAERKVSICTGEYTLDIGLQTSNNFDTSQISTSSIISDENSGNSDEKINLNELTSGVRYNDILPDTDMEYILSPNQLKENIIIREKQQEYCYQYVLSVADLFICQNEDNSFNLYAASEHLSDPVFSIAAPYMWDSNGQQSHDIDVSYETTAEGYIITYTANSAWINADERILPVTVDPTVIWSGNAQLQPLLSQNVRDTYVNSAAVDEPLYGSATTLLGNGSDAVNRIYTEITLPVLPSGAEVTSASYQLTSTQPLQHNVTAELYAVDDAWSYDQITWNNQPLEWLASDIVSSVSKTPDDDCIFKWDITSLVQRWYEAGINYGFAIKAQDETVQDNLLQFYSCSGYGVSGNVLPALVIEYTNEEPDEALEGTGFVAHNVLMQLNHDIVYVNNGNDIEDTLYIKALDGTICRPQNHNGTTMIPVEFFADIFGADLVWNPTEEQTIISINDNNFQIVPDDPQITKMDAQGAATRITLQHAPAIIDGCIHMAIRDLGYILGYSAIHYIPVTDENQILKEYVVLSKDADMTMEDASLFMQEKSQYLSREGIQKPEQPFILQTMLLELGHHKALVLDEEGLDRVYTVDCENDIYACPKNISGTIVPVRFFAESFGAETEWDSELSKMTFTYQNKRYEVTADSQSMLQTDANGETATVPLSRVPILDNGFLYMGIHDIRTIFGCTTIYYFGNFEIEPAQEYVVISKDTQMSENDAWALIEEKSELLHVKPQILCEDIDKRNEYEKHFVTDTGDYIAASYAEPVHYEQDGEWVDIDNSLVLSENGAEENVYENSDNPMQVQLAQSTENKDLLSIQSGEHQISWSMSAVASEDPLSFEGEEPGRVDDLIDKILVKLGMVPEHHMGSGGDSGGNENSDSDTFIGMNSVAAVLNDEDDISSENMVQLRSIPRNATEMSETNETDISEEYRNADMLTLENISSQIRYAETFDDVDVKYALSSMRVKEDIVIRQASDITTFAFLIRCEGLTAQKNEDNTVSFIDTSNNEEVFVINAPCMFDAADDFSARIRIDLEEIAGGYLMIYTPDTEWLNDAARVYPVTIDPDVSTSRDKLNIYDTYVKEGVNKSPNYDYYTQPSNLVGTYGGKKYRTFLRFANMPHISYDSKINSANLKLYLVSGTNTAQRLSFYKVQRNWTSTNVTWNFATTATNIGYSAYASYTPTKSAGFFSYNPSITGAVRGWYNCNGNRVRNVNGDSYNYGFMIRYANVNESGDYNRIISGENSNTSKRPCITINYTGSASSGGVTTTTPVKPPRTIADGTYFIRNMNSGKYLDVIGWGSVNKSNVVQYDFTGCTNQQWKITYGTDGYYRISPVHAPSKALDMRSESASRVNGTDAWIYDYSSTCQEQKWLIRAASGGGYEFITKASSNTNAPKVLEIENSSARSGAQAQIWTSSNSRTNDNWVLEKSHTLSTPQIGQQYDNWCWLACAEMAVRTSMKVTKKQIEAAKYVKNESTLEKLNRGGTAEEVIKAIEFFSNNSLSYTFEDRALSENELLKMLHSGNPVIIFRMEHHNDGTYISHATIIYGYHFIGNQLEFEIRDPWPLNPNPWPENNIGKSYSRTYRQIADGSSTGIDLKKWIISIYKKF